MKNLTEQYTPVEALSLDNMGIMKQKMTSYTGREGQLLYMLSERMRLNPSNHFVLSNFASQQELMDKVDDNVFNAISREYEVDVGQAKDLYHASINGSNSMMKDIVETALAGDNSKTFGLRNEVATYPNSYADRLVRMGQKYRDQGEQFQLLAQSLPADTLLNFYGNYPPREVDTQLYHFGQFLNEHFFASGEDATGLLEFAGWHSNTTNEFTGIAKQGDDLPGHHAKKHQLLTRELQNGSNGILVLTNSRVKNYVTAAEKAWGKALKNGGIVRPLVDVDDMAGIRVTTIGGVQERNYVFTKLLESIGDFGVDYIERYKFDSQLDGRTNTKKIDWLRAKVYLKGVGFPIEVIVDDLQVYLNSEYYIGPDGDPRKPPAHLKFERERAETLFRFFFPQSQYPSVYGRVDVEDLIRRKKQQVEDELISRNRVIDSELLENGFIFTPFNQNYNNLKLSGTAEALSRSIKLSQ